jgi:hypothetical protein
LSLGPVDGNTACRLADSETTGTRAMATTAADILVNSLLEWDVDTVFGIPGDGINGIMEALRQQRERIR